MHHIIPPSFFKKGSGPQNLWVPLVSWKYGTHSNRIGNRHCFNGFQVALNMLRPAFWSPVEPVTDFNVTPLLVPKAILGVAVGWRPVSLR